MNPVIIRILVALALAATAAPASALMGEWATDFNTPGPNAKVQCLLEWNGDAYAGGYFDAVGRTPVGKGVARWRDGAWEPVADPLDGGVFDLCVHDGAVHVLVHADPGRRVRRLDGDVWTAIGDVVPGSDAALASYQGDLYLGAHRLEDGVWVNRLQTDDAVTSLTVHDGLLVAGGDFTAGDGVATGPVLGWDGTGVVAAYPGQGADVQDLEVFEGKLHAGRYSGGGPLTAVQVWEDGAWVDIPGLGDVTFTDRLTDLSVGDGRLLACFYSFNIIIKSGGTRGSALRSWDGVQAETLYSPPSNARFLTTMEYGDGVLLGGDFTIDDGGLTAHLGLVRGGGIERVCEAGSGANATVDILRPGPGGLAVGGEFSAVGGVASRGVVLCESGAWTPRGLDQSNYFDWYSSPAHLAWHGGLLHTYAYGHAGNGLGYWQGDAWFFGDWGWDNQPADLASWDGRLLGPSLDAIYEYTVLGPAIPWAAVSGTARRLLRTDSGLVVAGDFAAVGGVAAQNIAVHRDGAWNALGEGLSEPVTALGWYHDQIIAVTRPGGDTSVNDVMAWNGWNWRFFARITGGPVSAVASYADCLFFGGSFDMPDGDGEPMTGIACWAGGRLHSVGAAPYTRALAAHDGKLWVAGAFAHAGGVPASRLTTLTLTVLDAPDATEPPSLVALETPQPNPFNPRTTLRFALPRAAHARLDVFDAAGRLVATVLDEPRAQGRHAVAWNGAGRDGRALPSGTYLVRLSAGGVVTTTRATLVR